MPRLIGYDDDGKAAHARDEIIIRNGGAREAMHVASWAETRDVQDIHAVECARGLVMSALQIAQAFLSDTIVAVSDGGRGEHHALVVLAAIMNANSIMAAAECKHPRAVRGRGEA